MNAETVFQNMQTALVGMQLSLLWRGYGSAIFLEFGQLTPNGKRRDATERNPKGEFTIGVEWSWRIEDHHSIVCGSWSEEDKWEPAFDLIRNTQLSEIDLFSTIPEIQLAFKGGCRLLSFNTSEGQPEWHIIDRRGKELVTLMVIDGKLALEEPKL